MLLVVLLGVAIAAQAQSLGCGDFEHHYGPFDYRTASKKQRDLVERFHFTQDVASLKKGASTSKIAGDPPLASIISRKPSMSTTRLS